MNYKSEYAKKLLDPRWQKKKTEIQLRDNFTCRDCGKTTETIHVHHCHYDKGDPWETENRFLLTLCATCHEKRGFIEKCGKRALAAIFAKIGQDEAHNLVKSMVAMADGEYEEWPRVIGAVELEGEVDAKWYQAAFHSKNKGARKLYETVTGRKVDWS